MGEQVTVGWAGTTRPTGETVQTKGSKIGLVLMSDCLYAIILYLLFVIISYQFVQYQPIYLLLVYQSDTAGLVGYRMR